MRPVVGVGKLFIRAVGRCRPSCPEEEVSQFFTRFFAWQCIVFHCKVITRLNHVGIIAVQLDVIRRNRLNGFLTGFADDNRSVFFHSGLVTVFVSQLRTQSRLLRNIQLFIVFAELSLCSEVQPGNQFAVQPVGSPVRSLISTVTQYRADLHTAGRLPSRLAGQNIVLSHQYLTGRRYNFFGIWRSFFINLRTHITQDGKADCQHCKQQIPELLILSHNKTPWVVVLKFMKYEC